MQHAITRLLDKEILECDKDGHLIDYVIKQMQNEIANYVMNELSSRGECIFKLYPPEACDFADSTHQYKIEQRISCVNLIRCENCRYRDIDGYCNELKYFVPGDFFCQKGKEKDDPKLEVEK